MSEAELRAVLNSMLPPPVIAALEHRAARHEITFKDVVKDALYSYAAKEIIETAWKGEMPQETVTF